MSPSLSLPAFPHPLPRLSNLEVKIYSLCHHPTPCKCPFTLARRCHSHRPLSLPCLGPLSWFRSPYFWTIPQPTSYLYPCSLATEGAFLHLQQPTNLPSKAKSDVIFWFFLDSHLPHSPLLHSGLISFSPTKKVANKLKFIKE